MATDAELYGAPVYEYPGYNTDPDFDYPLEEQGQGWDDPDELEPPIDWTLPDFDGLSEETLSVDALDSPAIAYPEAGTDSLMDYFAAHALNGLLSRTQAVRETCVDAAQIARVAYDCAEAMVRERKERRPLAVVIAAKTHRAPA